MAETKPIAPTLKEALIQLIDALDETKFDVFIGSPAELQRLVDTRRAALDAIQLADWPLVAAAPELLQALKAMICPVCDCSLGHEMRVIDRCSFCAKARAAIAKAEGRAAS